MEKPLQEELKKIMARYNCRSMKGQTLFNATGDVDASTLGYQIAIDTLTYIKKQVTEQKFYEVSPADYIPIAVGDGAFAQSILTNLTVSTARAFEDGIIQQGSGNDRLSPANSAIASKTVQVRNWAKATGYTIFEVEQALQANNWDIIESMHKARKKNWDLGIQEVSFLGLLGDQTLVPGLLNQSSSFVNSDTTTITESISGMSEAEFATFVQTVIAAYQSNNAYTAMPTHFIIPQDDYLGLSTPVSPTYPFNSKLEYLKKAFAEIVPGGVKILPLVYSMPDKNVSRLGGSGLHRYVMYRYDPETLRMDIPVDYTVTQPNTINNFQFQDAAYGQFTGVGVYRPLEVLYFDY